MANPTTTATTTIHPPSKRRKLSDDHHSLLPGLPDHIAHLCLSLVSPSTLYSVCRSWRRLLYSATFPPFRSLYTLSLPTTTAGTAAHGSAGEVLTLSSFDPISSKWITITSPPLPPFLHRLSHRHPSFISRSLPIQSFTVSGNLVLIAATSVHRNIPIPAFSHPIIFNPLTNTWSSGPPLSTPRRWCAAGAFQDMVVVASGVGSHYTETVARSVEKWVVRKIESFDQKRRDFNGNCEKIQSLMIPEIKIESFDEQRNGNLKKIQSLECLEIKTDSFEEKRRDYNGNCGKIESFKYSELKTESFDQKRNGNCEKIRFLAPKNLKIESFYDSRLNNCEKIQSFKFSELKTQSFDQKCNRFLAPKNSKIESFCNSHLNDCEKIQSFNFSELKTESFVGNCETIQFLAPKISNIESFRNSHLASLQKIQSLKFSELKTESFDEKLNGNCAKTQSFEIPELKTESFYDKRSGNSKKIQSLTIPELKTESFDEKQDGNWIKMRSLKNSKLCREPIDAIGWKGKLCMVNVKGDFTKEGFIYNLDSDEWAEMPVGMLGGWRGPVAAMEEATMYVVDESRGVLRRYNEDVDNWSEVMVDERLKGAEYIAAGGGKVCVVCENHVGIVVVDVAVVPPRLRVVEMAPGHEILGVYIMPRMCLPEF
ncbi:putative kelch-type beta propeller, leucine-rich repeat domain superfamily [Helianthus annuus]|uniref:Kelch-type beta propeller, leucine-rich repeat domain superfamily n=1 Tax=Helianthus annuus TaxID=4232 RepID=A0A251S9H8_HELAN|nr:putative kelch-type beta propeller, leucine-rich repeat domain superfamily [Helianthus annuus]KAJ0471729.1 putative kelch-type beta propeller, leucine-rich repeat domain superfamily [Helianthus annuus]KAJ0647370.1 putative kelch-type beta propeller, leucine-rich repeat domain superfamily [Helianthus annuus]